ncbi:MAG: type VI secretion system tip protein VgrG [Bacteroides sp.]|nr:type VI secretion system tip protein VgrG [Bacteroides sp.]
MAEQAGKGLGKRVCFTVYSEGLAIGDRMGVISVHISQAVNRVGRCTIVLDAGDMPSGEIPESDDDTFAPGKDICVEAGYDDEESVVFEGMVTTHGLTIGEGNESRLVVECREYTYPLTLGRKNRVFEDTKDSEAIRAIVGDGSGLQAEVSETSVTHPQLVQYGCTDWDFIRSRADATGMVVVTDGKKLIVRKPDTGSPAVVKVMYGADLIEFEGELIAATQYAAAKAVGWDPATQQVKVVTTTAPSLNDQGNQGQPELAEVGGSATCLLQTQLFPDPGMLQAWADAQLLREGLGRIRGMVRFVGNALPVPGCLIELEGVGERFNGSAYAGAVEHEIRQGEWVTTVEMGLSPEQVTARPDVQMPGASGLWPAVSGLHIGVVSQLEEDPAREFWIQVQIPTLCSDRDTVWARLGHPLASKGSGSFFVPDVGDEVILGFFNNDPSQAVILGSLYSSSRSPVYPLTADNYIRGWKSREGMKITFDEEKKVVTLETPAGNTVILNDDQQEICLADQNGNKIQMNASGIAIESSKQLSLKADTDLQAEAGTAFTMKAKTDLKAEGMNVELKAQTTLKAQGTASAEFSASGQTTVKGAMVMIN